MNIGGKAATVALKTTSQQTFVDGSVLGSAFDAISKSFMSAGINGHELEMALKERQRAQTRAIADTDLTRTMGEQDRALLESQQNMAPGAKGFTGQVAASLPTTFDEFAKRTGIADDPTLMAEYRPRWEAFAQDHITKAFGLEINESNRFVLESVTKSFSEHETNVHNHPENFDKEFTSLTETIDKSDLPGPVKDDLKTQAYNQLAGALMTTESQRAAADMLPVREPDGKDVVAPGLSPAARAFLNTTSSYESPGGAYNIRYDGKGGTTFDDYSDHPRVPVERPDGRTSTAAGRYQFTATTWDALVKEMNAQGYNITDFSPVNQDRVAWYLAQKDFARKTGKSLEQVLATGNAADLEEVRVSLTGTWEGFGSQDAAQTFADRIVNGVTLGGTGHSQAPDPWTDPRYAGLPYDMKLQGQQQGQEQINAARRAQAAAAAAETKARTDALLLDLAKGVPGAEAKAVKAIDTGWITDIEDVQRLDAATKQFREDNKTTFDVSMQLSEGKMLGMEQAPALDIFYKNSKIVAGMQSLDEQSRSAFTDITVKQGQIPPKMMGLLQSQLSSSSAKDRAFAMSTLVDIYEQNPAVFSSLPKDFQQQVILAHTLMKYVPSAEMAGQKFGEMQTAEHGVLAQNALDTFDKAFKDGGGSAFFETARKAFDAGGFMGMGSDGTSLPDPSAGALARFESNYMTLFRENLALTGSEDSAHKMTASMMKDVWAPGPFNGQLMEASPLAPGMVKRAAFLPPALPGQNPLALNGSMDWVEHTIEAQLGNPAGKVAIAADPQTLEDMKKLGYPTYKAFIYDENGLITEAPLRVNVQMTQPVIARELDRPTKAQADAKKQQDILDGKITPDGNAAPGVTQNLTDLPEYWKGIGDSIAKAHFALLHPAKPLVDPSVRAKNFVQDRTIALDAAHGGVRSGMDPSGAADQRARAPISPERAAAVGEHIKMRGEQQAVASAKALRDAAVKKIRRDNPSYDAGQAERAYDLFQIMKTKGVSIQEAVKLYEGSK